MENNIKQGEKAKAVSPLPCILMIIFLPFILVYLALSLLFVPIDYLIFKTSKYHRDFGGKYSFLSGAHPDNTLYTLIKAHKTPVIYAKCDKTYSSHGFFFTRDALIEARDLLFFDKESGEWMGALPTTDGAKPCSIEELSSELGAAFTKATGGMKRERVIFLLRRRAAKRGGGSALEKALSDERITVYTKSALLPSLTALSDGE